MTKPQLELLMNLLTQMLMTKKQLALKIARRTGVKIRKVDKVKVLLDLETTKQIWMLIMKANRDQSQELD